MAVSVVLFPTLQGYGGSFVYRRAQFGYLAVQVRDVRRTRTLVQVIDVLCDDFSVGKRLLQAGDSQVCGIRLRCQRITTPCVVKLYAQLRIAQPCIVGTHILYTIFLP